MPERKKLVGVIESDPSTLRLLQYCLEREGFKTSGEFFTHVQDIEHYSQFTKRYNPRIIVFDVPYPYEQNLEYIKQLIALKESKNRGFVITTTNKRLLKTLMKDMERTELIEKPFEIDEIIEAVKNASLKIRKKKL